MQMGRSDVHCTLIAIVFVWDAFWLHLVCGITIQEARPLYSTRTIITRNGLPHLACNYTTVASNGSVSSPGYPDNYPDNRDCWITLRSPNPQDQIYLNFEVLDLEHSLGCVFDYLQIFDGNSTDADRLGRFCNIKPESSLQSSTNHILLHFHSDYLLNGKGFLLKFDSASNAELEKPVIKSTFIQFCPTSGDALTGTVTSPNYPQRYGPNSNCTSVLLAPNGHHFLLNFEHVDIEYDEMCLFDYLEVRDGPTSESPLMTLVCGRKTPGYSLGSTANKIYLQFVSDEFVEFQGFKLLYQALPLKDDDEEEDVAEGDDELGNESEEDDEMDNWLDFVKDVPDGLDLSEPPIIMAQPHNATVSEGFSHVLDCFINGSNSAVVWLKDHSVISAVGIGDDSLQLLSNKSLLITNMSAEMEGIYTCVILSEHGALSFNAWVMLDWNGAGDTDCNLEFREMPRDTTLVEGQNTFLTCYVYEEANITWLKDGEPIEELPDFGNRVQLLIDNVLLINKAAVNDSGIYTCLAIERLTGCVKTVDAALMIVWQQSVDDVCGKPHVKALKQRRLGKVVHGNNAEKGAYPWQAMLWERWSGLFCGGSLVNRRWVITAAHCFTEFQQRFSRNIKISDLLVKLGKHDQSKVEVTEQVVGASAIVIHPSFNTSNYDSDIALVQLVEPVRFTESVLPVCLTDQEYLRQKLYNESHVVGTLTGWGMITERGMPPAYLQEVRLPLVPWRTCLKSTKYTVTNNMFCAGYMKQVMGDACHGDSGGPLTAQYDGRWYLLGVVSWGEGCDREGKYGFYTNVGKYIPWLQSTMGATKFLDSNDDLV